MGQGDGDRESKLVLGLYRNGQLVATESTPAAPHTRTSQSFRFTSTSVIIHSSTVGDELRVLGVAGIGGGHTLFLYSCQVVATLQGGADQWIQSPSWDDSLGMLWPVSIQTRMQLEES